MLSCSDFAKHALKLELYPKQAEILNSFFTGGYTQATWALGRRCVTGDTLVPTRRGMIEIGSLRGLGAPVKTVDGDGWSSLGLDVAQPHGGAANAVLFYDGGVQKIKRLRTALGIELRGTPNHPIMTLDEHGKNCWKSLENIEPGDPIVLQAGGNIWNQKEPSAASIEYVRMVAGRLNDPATTPDEFLSLSLIEARSFAGSIDFEHLAVTERVARALQSFLLNLGRICSIYEENNVWKVKIIEQTTFPKNYVDTVEEIDNAGEEEVYDFHVPGSNAFVGNGICQHNSGKTLMAAVACVYICFVLEDKYKRKVRKGEKWYVLTVANSQDQSRIALNNIRQLILDSPFAKEIVRETADQLEISNNCVFKAIPTSGRAARGLACCACVFDELAFAVDGDANSGGKGIYDALSPAVAQFGKDGKILELSSPWLTDGLFYQHFKEAASGRFPNLQAVNLPTWEMNPTISKEFLDLERQRDPDKFKVEYGAQFANNLSALISSDVVDACVDDSRHALPPIEAFIGSYVLSLDPARGGLGRDNYTACIVHFEGNTLVVDKFHTFMADFEINGRKEVNIVAVEDWIKEQHKLYLFDKIVMDQYNSAGTIQNLSGEYPIEELTWTISSKVKAFSKMRELFNGGLVQLYNHEKAINEIKNLTVVYRAGGQWTVTGGKQTGIDDHAFALAAAIHAADREDDVNWLQDFL